MSLDAKTDTVCYLKIFSGSIKIVFPGDHDLYQLESAPNKEAFV
jgi:hypothetical protein